MKKTTLTIVMATLCFFLKANGQDNKTINVTTKAIQIGQKVPDVTINNIHNYKTTSAKLSDFKGKLVILDFWATWCSPCVAMIPKMDSLQKQFGDKIQFISITYQNDKEVIPFLEKVNHGKISSIINVTGNTMLAGIFPHNTIPHYIWIDKNGVLKAITYADEINKKNITELLKGNDRQLDEKSYVKVQYDDTKPLIVDDNGGNFENIVYRSIFSKYKEGLKSFFTIVQSNNFNGFRITCTNLSFLDLFRLSYGEGKVLFNKNRISLKIKDTTVYSRNNRILKEWSKSNLFSYELIVPIELKNRAFKIMQNDVKNFFRQYLVKIEPENKKSLVLIRTSNKDKIKTKGGKSESNLTPFGGAIKNMPLDRLLIELSTIYLQGSPYPVFDGTRYKGNVDLAIDAKLSDVESLNKALAQYDLELIIKEKKVDVMTFRDSGLPTIFQPYSI